MKTLLSFTVILALLLTGCGDDEKQSRSDSPDDASQESQSDKMKALEDAYKAGILSEEEYQQKKEKLAQQQVAKVEDNENKSTTGVGSGDKKKIWTNPAPAKLAGQLLKHPSGFSFWVPAGWQTKMLQGIMQVHPPESKPDADKYETYFVTTETTGAGVSIHDPQIIQYLDQMMIELGRELGGIAFSRSKSPTKVDIPQGKGKGLKAIWTGQSNVGQVKAEVYSYIHNNTGCVLIALGVKDRLEKRSATISRIFNSFSVGEGKLDSQLVGSWQLKRVNSMTNWSVFETSYSRAQAVNESNSTLTFKADGTWERVDQSQFLAGGGGLWVESNDKSVSKGKWNADSGALFMLWQDKSFEDYKYKLDGSNLIMMSGKTGQQWKRIR